MILQGVRDVHHVDRFDEWREQLKNLPLMNKLWHERYPDIFLQPEQAINLIIGHLAAFCALSEHGAPEPGRGGRKRIMRHLARAAFTEMFVLDWNPEQLIEDLVPLENKTQSILIGELARFKETIARCHTQLKAKSGGLSLDSLKQFKKEEGLPVPLAYQFICSLPDSSISFINQQQKIRAIS